ncbi:MAG TPA: hypothetical protein VH280_21380 [Verrucomicrobiae bacterium]|jgi:hypothetical protein|nr:hypothetical protein [Verrucomicrobiae bacterium]
MRLILKVALLVATALVAKSLHAQLPFSNADLAVIESTTPLSAADMPYLGTFYSAANPGYPPLPGNILGLDGWSLGDGFYLLNDVGEGGSTGGFSAMDESEPPFPGGGGGAPYNFTNGYAYPTNGLWLQITNTAGGLVYANLNGATDTVYEIYSTTNLPVAAAALSNWDVEMEVFPGVNTNTMPFTVAMNGRDLLFLWARDWTGITSNGNLTPDSWLYYWFGIDGLSFSDTNLDTSGNTLLFDYTNGFDPNFIQFSISVTNQYTSELALMQLNVTAGQPYYMAMLVDDTNFADAIWNSYTSSIVRADLGSAQGWHNVYVGLRGLPADATPTWLWQHLFVAAPPTLIITNPTTFAVDEPVIQIRGLCQESLANLSYDISNAGGFFPNQPSEITDQYFDTNALGITTNYFECLDVPLTNGLNTITMHATDLAGDTTVTNFYFTVDYSGKTNPPILQITWPQNGAQISGSSFMCSGTISDPTATVTASLVATNGDGTSDTNVYQAEVGRDGNFSLENLPLNLGTNSFKIAAQDVLGHAAVTNISIVQTNFGLTINPVSSALQLWQGKVCLTGTISDPTYAVWVNGIKGTNNGDGTWSAMGVPTDDGNFAATAYAPNEQQPDGSYGN